MFFLAQADPTAKAVPDSCFTIWIVAAIGSAALFGAFKKMKEGWGPQNLRAVGLVLVATFASLLAIHERGSVTTAFSILGAIAGYLFGTRDTMTNQKVGNSLIAKNSEQGDETGPGAK